MAKEEKNISVVLREDCDYRDWLVELKERFYSHRLKAACATNNYLLDFCWISTGNWEGTLKPNSMQIPMAQISTKI